ncbi:M23 family metallopeptidase [Streptomyces sp. DHE17-7]|nr:M23 family metallopeptidase [Streptomyces sp. DHE17-7]RIH60479.1 M23 family peptidase [Streptomyces sp. SHP22-7]RSS66336.1 M23 family metallopeptidase [Streptomyces sp. WAC06273]
MASQPHGHQNHSFPQAYAGHADTDQLLGGVPGTYDEPVSLHHAWHVNQGGGPDAAPSWDQSGYPTELSEPWRGGQWAVSAGQDSSTLNAAVPSPAPSGDEAPTSPGMPEEPEAGARPTASPGRRAARRAGGRRRGVSRRGSAFLSVVAPSAAFLGVAGIAAASVGFSGGSKEPQAAPGPSIDPATVNSEFDTQLASLSREADDFADRATRTQERIDLDQQRQEEQQRRAAEAARKKAEAARREALRPKFVLPVAQKGVGELFGAAGSMWSNRHTGLDFPVPMNTPVRAVTDGTVVAEWNPYYGNLVKMTAPDGTQTWYAHLASARIRSGYVKAGTVIGYAGSSGNSSGPHLHLEVHPDGGPAIDPLAWLRSHGLDPT